MVNLENVMEAISSVTGVESEEIFGKNRKRQVAAARHMFCYMARKYTNATLGQAGKFLGRDHTTAINSVKVCNDMLDINDDVFVNTLSEIDAYIIRKFKNYNEILVQIPFEVNISDVKEFLVTKGCILRTNDKYVQDFWL